MRTYLSLEELEAVAEELASNVTDDAVGAPLETQAGAPEPETTPDAATVTETPSETPTEAAVEEGDVDVTPEQSSEEVDPEEAAVESYLDFSNENYNRSFESLKKKNKSTRKPSDDEKRKLKQIASKHKTLASAIAEGLQIKKNKSTRASEAKTVTNKDKTMLWLLGIFLIGPWALLVWWFMVKNYEDSRKQAQIIFYEEIPDAIRRYNSASKEDKPTFKSLIRGLLRKGKDCLSKIENINDHRDFVDETRNSKIFADASRIVSSDD